MSHSNENPRSQYRRKETSPINPKDNVLVSLYSWLLLIAGFIMFPGIFRALHKAGVLGKADAERLAQKAVKRLPSPWIAIFFCTAGIFLWIWWNLKRNYVWLATKLFLCVLRQLF